MSVGRPRQRSDGPPAAACASKPHGGLLREAAASRVSGMPTDGVFFSSLPRASGAAGTFQDRLSLSPAIAGKVPNAVRTASFIVRAEVDRWTPATTSPPPFCATFRRRSARPSTPASARSGSEARRPGVAHRLDAAQRPQGRQGPGPQERPVAPSSAW